MRLSDLSDSDAISTLGLLSIFCSGAVIQSRLNTVTI